MHWVTVRRHGHFVTERRVTEGPIACILTTTKDRLVVDDETRHISVWIDQSPEQTARIALREVTKDKQEPLSAEELEIWHEVQNIFSERAAWRIDLPSWFELVARQLRVDDVAVRRYFPAFLQASKTVCLLRSFQRKDQDKLSREKKLRVNFTDYAITWLIFNPVFAESLDQADDEDVETLRQVEKISARNNGAPVQASDLVRAMNVSPDRAYSLLRSAVDAGTIRRANPPAQKNIKLYSPAIATRFAPDPASIFRQLDRPKEAHFVHPLTGKLVVYRRGPKKSADGE